MQTRFPRWKLAVFALLSVCDFVITYLLVSRSGGHVYESNPVADQWLQQGGWIGLAAFKTIIVFSVSVIAIYIFYRRPRIAHDLLAIACGAVVVAVVTGTSIAVTKAETPSEEASHNPRFVMQAPSPRERSPVKDYLSTLESSSYELAASRTDLEHAVTELKKSNRANDDKWIASLREAYPGMEDHTLFACDLLQHTIGMRIRGYQARQLAERLEREFVVLYGVEPNLPYRQLLHLAPARENRVREGNRGERGESSPDWHR